MDYSINIIKMSDIIRGPYRKTILGTFEEYQSILTDLDKLRGVLGGAIKVDDSDAVRFSDINPYEVGFVVGEGEYSESDSESEFSFSDGDDEDVVVTITNTVHDTTDVDGDVTDDVEAILGGCLSDAVENPQEIIGLGEFDINTMLDNDITEDMVPAFPDNITAEIVGNADFSEYVVELPELDNVPVEEADSELPLPRLSDYID